MIGIYSRDRGRAEAFAQKHGIARGLRFFRGPLEKPRHPGGLYRLPEFPPCLGTKMAAEAGKHVLVEKPMAVNVSEALDMVNTCRKQGVKLGVGFHLRHHPGHRRARQLIQEGILGLISLAQAQFFFTDKRGVMDLPPRGGLSQWWEDPIMTGGAYSIMGMGVHALDLLQFLLGQPITEVAAITDGQTVEKPLESIATIALRFAMAL